MLAPVSHFVCLVSLQSYWETITSQSVHLRLAVKRIVIQEAWTVYDLIWTRVEFFLLLNVVLLKLCSSMNTLVTEARLVTEALLIMHPVLTSDKEYREHQNMKK